MAEVMKFDDFKEEGSEAAAKVWMMFCAVSNVGSVTVPFTICFERRLASIDNKERDTSWKTEILSCSNSMLAPD